MKDELKDLPKDKQESVLQVIRAMNKEREEQMNSSENCESRLPTSVEEVRERLDQSRNGKIYNTANNYKKVLQLDPLLQGAIRKNLLSERIDIVKSLGWYRENNTYVDVDLKYLLLYLEGNYDLNIEKKVDDAVKVIANENRYHPIQEYLENLRWDGKKRIRECLHHFLGAHYNAHFKEPLPKITPHICRHTFCSKMARNGMNPKNLQYIMGHSEISITLDTYTHLGFSDARKDFKRCLNEAKNQKMQPDKS